MRQTSSLPVLDLVGTVRVGRAQEWFVFSLLTGSPRGAQHSTGVFEVTSPEKSLPCRALSRPPPITQPGSPAVVSG